MNRLQKAWAIFGVLTAASLATLGSDFAFGYSLTPLDWSPDGKWIVAELAYGGFRDGYALALVSAKTGRVERTLFENPGGAEGCRWATFSPDSRFITYHRICMGDYVVDLEAKHTAMIGSWRAPTWSPDGTWLAVRDSVGSVYKIRPDGTNWQSLGKIGEPYWRNDGTLEVLGQANRTDSPDGHWYAFLKPASDDGKDTAFYGWNLWVYDQETKHRKMLETNVMQRSAFAWRPNGELVYTKNTDAGSSVVAYSPKTQQRRVLTEGCFWKLSPDGSQLALYGENRVAVVRIDQPFDGISREKQRGMLE